jgi:caspase 7
MDVLQMLTLVNKVVAYDFESYTDEDFNSGMKQVPCIVSTLTKLCYFERKL